jgi:hypothetical protein
MSRERSRYTDIRIVLESLAEVGQQPCKFHSAIDQA